MAGKSLSWGNGGCAAYSTERSDAESNSAQWVVCVDATGAESPTCAFDSTERSCGVSRATAGATATPQGWLPEGSATTLPTGSCFTGGAEPGSAAPLSGRPWYPVGFGLEDGAGGDALQPASSAAHAPATRARPIRLCRAVRRRSRLPVVRIASGYVGSVRYRRAGPGGGGGRQCCYHHR